MTPAPTKLDISISNMEKLETVLAEATALVETEFPDMLDNDAKQHMARLRTISNEKLDGLYAARARLQRRQP